MEGTSAFAVFREGQAAEAVRVASARMGFAMVDAEEALTLDRDTDVAANGAALSFPRSATAGPAFRPPTLRSPPCGYFDRAELKLAGMVVAKTFAVLSFSEDGPTGPVEADFLGVIGFQLRFSLGVPSCLGTCGRPRRAWERGTDPHSCKASGFVGRSWRSTAPVPRPCGLSLRT